MTVRLRVMQLLCKNSDHDLGGTHLQCINKNMVSLSICCDAKTVRYDQAIWEPLAM